MNKDNPTDWDKRGPGMEPIPEPDKGKAGRIGATGKLEEIVGSLMGDDPDVSGGVDFGKAAGKGKDK